MATSSKPDVDIPLDDLRELLPDWDRHLKAENKSPNTRSSYLRVATEFVGFLVEQAMPTGASEITHEHVEHYIGHLQERPNKRTGKKLSEAEVAKQYRSLQQLFRWLQEVEGEITVSPFAKLSPPKVNEQPVPVLTHDQLKALLASCKGKSFENLRDTALIRLFMDTGARCGEIAPMRLENKQERRPSDLDFDTDVIHVMGKGRRARTIPFGAKTGEALRRYLRARARHPYAEKTDAVWLGRKGALTDWGIRQLLDRRAEDAGVPKVYPHLFRHTAAHEWLANGGQEQDAMRLFGWRSREMLGRYGASAADERARDAHRKKALGDRF